MSTAFAVRHEAPQDGPGITRLLILNPNTNPEVTQRVQQVADGFASEGLQLKVCNPSRGPFSIENPQQRSQAEREVLALLGAIPQPLPDAIVLACFDDLALQEARALTGRPVVGACDAGISAARAISPRFAIVTTVHAALPGIRNLMERYGAGAGASVHAAGIGVAMAAQAGPEALDAVTAVSQRAMRDHGAEVILLASGGLAALAPSLANRLGIPVVDGVHAAIAHALALLKPT
jgi:allantoin racemase